MALLLPVAVAATAMADEGPQWTDAELAALSKVVVLGRVTAVDAAWDPAVPSIYTYVRVAVLETLRGPGLPAEIVLKQPGGAVGSVGHFVGGQPTFSAGEEVVLFLEVRPRDATLYTAAFWQGKWSVWRRGDDAIAVRNAGFASNGREIAPQQRSLSSIYDVVRQAPAASAPVAVNTIPAEAPAPSPLPEPRRIDLLGFAWQQAYLGTSVALRFQPVRQPGVGTGKRQLKNAANRWMSVAGSIRFLGRPKKHTGEPTGQEFRGDDPSILLQNLDPLGEIDDSGGVIALGGAWYFFNPVINGSLRAASGYVVTNDSPLAVQFLGKRTCYENVIAHELGHAVGLNHSDDRANLMYPSLSAVSCRAGPMPLGGDDVAGWLSLYADSMARR